MSYNLSVILSIIKKEKELKNSKYRAKSHLGELCTWGGFFVFYGI